MTFIVCIIYLQTRLEPIIEDAGDHELKKSSKRTLPADCGDSLAKRGSVSSSLYSSANTPSTAGSPWTPECVLKRGIEHFNDLRALKVEVYLKLCCNYCSNSPANESFNVRIFLLFSCIFSQCSPWPDKAYVSTNQGASPSFSSTPLSTYTASSVPDRYECVSVCIPLTGLWVGLTFCSSSPVVATRPHPITKQTPATSALLR